MVRNADDTRRRLLAAATAEFSSFGIAGARVDRIAEAAQCNKQSIYAHFGSKEGLFDAVYDAMVLQTVDAVPIDARDLPGYATRLFDRYRAKPEILRLATWYQLERAGTTPPPESAVQAGLKKVAAIKAAQKAGLVNKQFAAADLLTLVLKLSAVAPHSSEASLADRGDAVVKQAIHDAVARLVAT